MKSKTEEKAKGSQSLIELLDSENRWIAFNDVMQATWEKKYNYQSPDQQLLGFVQDDVAMVSDCYILYAVAYFGMATADMIADFLRMKERTGYSLSIIRLDVDSNLAVRLRVLRDRGYLYTYSYRSREDGLLNQIYGVNDEAFVMIRQRLDKNTFPHNHGIAYKTVRRLSGWVSAGYVGSRLMQSPRVACELDRTYFNKKLKNNFFPFEFLSRGDDGALFYVCGMDGNWDRDPETQTPRDYEEWLRVQADLLYCYVNYRTDKGTPLACLVVRDSASLKNVASVIAKAEGLRDSLDRIVFTGEGVFRERSPKGSEGLGSGTFLKMRVDGDQIVFSALDKVNFV